MHFLRFCIYGKSTEGIENTMCNYAGDKAFAFNEHSHKHKARGTCIDKLTKSRQKLSPV